MAPERESSDPEVILFPIYVALVWAGAFAFRRRWIGFAIAVGSVAPVGAAFLFGAERWLPGASATAPAMILLPAMYGAIVCAGGLMFAWQRPAPRVACGACGYDLAGNVSGVCPECGTAAAERWRRGSP